MLQAVARASRAMGLRGSRSRISTRITTERVGTSWDGRQVLSSPVLSTARPPIRRYELEISSAFRRRQTVEGSPRTDVGRSFTLFVLLMFLRHDRRMDRGDLVCPVKEALLRNRLFRPHRRDWPVHRADDERRAGSVARAIVDHL